MDKNKIGLGRGLSAILGEMDETENQADGRDYVTQMNVSELEAGIYQPRKTFNEENLNDLISSVREKGILQPLLVRRSPRHPEKYEIIAGERRFRAAQEVGLNEVPVIIKDFSDRETLEVSLIENLQRQDLNPMEEAEGYVRLLNEFRHTQEELARVVGKSRSHVANMMRLLELPEGIRRSVEEGKLTAGHARALLNAKNPEFLAEKVINEGLSVRETEALSVSAGEKKTRQTKTLFKDGKESDIAQIEADLVSVLKVPVTIKWNGKRGKIVLDCPNLEKLDLILERLTQGGIVDG